MKVLGIVPARGGSKRLTRKNLRLLAGKPLVLWALEAACASTTLDRVVVSSDDDEILALVAGTAATPLKRPADLASDLSPAIDYVRHAIGAVDVDDDPYDAVAIVQPSSPLTEAADIDALVELLRRSRADSAASVVRVPHDVHPAKFKTLEGDRLLPYLEREDGRMAAEHLVAVYVRNGAVYAATRAAIDRGCVVSDDCRGYEMPRHRSVDINDAFDLALADHLLSSRPSEQS